MNNVLIMLAAFVALGLSRHRLGPTRTYVTMGAVILVYVAYAYVKG